MNATKSSLTEDEARNIARQLISNPRCILALAKETKRYWAFIPVHPKSQALYGASMIVVSKLNGKIVNLPAMNLELYDDNSLTSFEKIKRWFYRRYIF